MSDLDDREPSRAVWWAAFAAVALLLLLPLVMVDVPPLLDYPNHLARLYVLAHPDDAMLSRYYAQRWAIMPNLAIDGLLPPLLRWVPVHVAGRLILGATLLLPVLGCIIYHRALFGRRSLWPLGAGLVAYNASFFLGFVNFQLTLGLALIAAAGWHAWSRRRPLVTTLAGAVCAVGLFFCHLFGLGFFVGLVGAGELAGLRASARGGTPLLAHCARRAAMLAAMLCVPVVLYLHAPLSGSTGASVARPWLGKLYVAFSAFAHYDNRVTLLTAGAVLLAVCLIAFAGRLRAGAGTLVSMGGLAVLYVLLPSVAFDTAFVDTRIPIMVALLLFAGFQPARVPQVAGGLAGAVLAGALVIQVGATSVVWLQQARDVAGLRTVIASIRPGARVLAADVSDRENPAYWASVPANRKLPGYMRLNGHLPALLLIEHQAFWPLLFTMPTKQPLVVLPPYDRISAQEGSIPDLGQLADPAKLAQENDTRYLANWQHDFDYVLLMDPMASGDPGKVMPDRLSLLVGNNVAALYRVRHQAAASLR